MAEASISFIFHLRLHTFAEQAGARGDVYIYKKKSNTVDADLKVPFLHIYGNGLGAFFRSFFSLLVAYIYIYIYIYVCIFW